MVQTTDAGIMKTTVCTVTYVGPTSDGGYDIEAVTREGSVGGKGGCDGGSISNTLMGVGNTVYMSYPSLADGVVAMTVTPEVYAALAVTQTGSDSFSAFVDAADSVVATGPNTITLTASGDDAVNALLSLGAEAMGTDADALAGTFTDGTLTLDLTLEGNRIVKQATEFDAKISGRQVSMTSDVEVKSVAARSISVPANITETMDGTSYTSMMELMNAMVMRLMNPSTVS